MTEEEMKAAIEAAEKERDDALAEKKTALGEKFKASKANETLQQQLTEAEENAKNANADELTKANSRIAKLEKDLLAEQAKAATSDSNLRSYKTDNEIAKLLVSHKVQNEDHDIVSAYFRSLTKFDDEGNPVAQDKPLNDFAKEYFTGAGKRYTTMPDNSGGGSTGNNGTATPREFNETEYAMMKKTDPAQAAAWAKATGNNYLNEGSNGF